MASTEPNKAVERFLEAFGGIMIAAGFEWLIFVERPSPVIVTGFIAGGIGVFFSGAYWQSIKLHIPDRLIQSVEAVALDFRYWMALVLLGWLSLLFLSIVQKMRVSDSVATINGNIESLRADVKQIRTDMNRYVMPRHLSDEASKKISDYLLKYEPKQLTIVFVTNSEEAGEYELDFERAFKTGGWKVDRLPADKFPDGLSLPEGLSTYFRGEPTKKADHDDKHPDADSLLNAALRQANIEPESGSGGGADNGTGTYSLCLGINRRRMDDGPIQAKKQAIEQLRKLADQPD